jgi:ribosomal 30S subunit maturation factor RimM
MNQQTVVENIDQYLADDMPVYDVNGDKVGKVKMFSTAAGYLMVSQGAFEKDYLYIPFRLIRTIDPHDVFLTERKETLTKEYTNPPTISTLTEQRLVRTPDGGLTSETRQVQMVQSGYDYLPAKISSVDAGDIARRLAVGMAVYDAEEKRLGDVTQYDTARSLLVVESGIFKPRALFVPFSAVQSIDSDAFTIHLSLPRDIIVKEHAMLPADA